MEQFKESRESRFGRTGLAVILIAITLLVLVVYLVVMDEVRDLGEVIHDHGVEIGSVKKQIPAVSRYIILVKEIEQKSGGKLNVLQVTEIAQIILVQSNRYSSVGLTPQLILAVIERESMFDPNAISYAQAYGLMQVTEGIFKIHLAELEYGEFTKDLAMDPIVNIKVGIMEMVRLKKYWLKHGTDSWMVAMTSYFWGIRNTWSLLETKNRASLPSLEYGKSIIELSKGWLERGVQ